MIELFEVTKRYGDIEALRDVSLKIEKGEVLTVLGPNGSGKTTLLKIMGGLEIPTSGEVFFNGLRADKGVLAEIRRRATLIFQRTVVLRGSVFDNVAFGLRQRGIAEDEVRRRVRGALELVGLEALSERRAKSLSGGEQQRLSLARALVLGCDCLLLDEPTSNLDPESLSIVKEAISSLKREKGVTIVMATHNLGQAEELSERVVLLDEGRVVEDVHPKGLLLSPSARMAMFTRSDNVFTGDSKLVDGVSHVDIGSGVAVRTAFSQEGRVTIYVRPEDIILSRERMESSARNTLRGSILSVEDTDSVVRLRVDVGRVFTIQITRRSLVEMGLNVGQEVYLTFKASSVYLL